MARKLTVVCGDVTAALNRRPQLMKRFIEMDPQARFVCPGHEPKYLDQIREMGFDVHIIDSNKQSLNPLSDLAYYREIRKYLQSNRPDDVFVFHLKPIMHTAQACRRLGIRCHALFAGLGFVFSEEKSLKRVAARALVSKWLKSSLKKTTTVFFQNPDDRNTLEQAGILSSQSNVVVVNGSGVDMDDFPFTPVRTEDPVTFLLIARILRDKGIPEYYEAAKRLRDKYGDQVRVQLLGPFDDNPNIMSRETIDQWHREGMIEYLGVTDDVRPFLKDMSIFVLPSFYMEGTPKTILESLAIGRAIITTDSRGCRETVQHETNGFLIPPRDVEALYAAMEHFVENRNAISEMGQASFDYARAKYDVNKVNQGMIDEMKLEN